MVFAQGAFEDKSERGKKILRKFNMEYFGISRFFITFAL